MKESKAMMRKEVAFMKKKGAPKSMIKHEEAEYGMKKGVKKMAGGGSSPPPQRGGGLGALYGGVGANQPRKMREGGSTGSFRRVADGIASKGKTKGKMVKMNKGGYC